MKKTMRVREIGTDCQVDVYQGDSVVWSRIYCDWNSNQIWDEVSDCGLRIFIETAFEFYPECMVK